MTKIINLREPVRDTAGRFSLKTATQRLLTRLCSIIVTSGKLTLVAWLMFGSLTYGINYAKGNEVSFVAPVFAESVVTNFPILDKIAKAESKNRQFGSDGQALIHVNTNGTYDIGYYQINSIWNAQATKLGYNLSLEADNKAFAQWLFENYGSEPWNSSRATWGK